VQAELRQAQIQAAAANPLDGAQHAQLILLALASPNTPDQLLPPAAVRSGQAVWIRRQDLGDARAWRIAVDAPALQDWVLAERLTNPAGSAP
jgi:hypothetical protein